MIVYLLSVFNEAVSEKSGKLRIIIEKCFRSKLTNTKEVAHQDCIKGGALFEVNGGHFD